jgi:hypothetical protein
MCLQTAEKAAYLKGLQASHERTAAAPAPVPPGSRSDGYAQHTPDATHARPGAYDGRKGNQSKAAEESRLPFFMRKDDDKKDDDKKDENPFAKKDDDKKDDEKKDENPFAKKDDEKEKEAAMRETIKRINYAMQAGAR